MGLFTPVYDYRKFNDRTEGMNIRLLRCYDTHNSNSGSEIPGPAINHPWPISFEAIVLTFLVKSAQVPSPPPPLPVCPRCPACTPPTQPASHPMRTPRAGPLSRSPFRHGDLALSLDLNLLCQVSPGDGIGDHGNRANLIR